jgi:dTDP-4-amino-4,6-dideoxygalactose transaminase
MIVPFHRPYITDDEINAAADSIRNGWLTMGKKTIDFETRFREYLGSPYAVSVNSCTAALHLALYVIGLKAGDEVIIPTVTFASSAEVVRYFDAIPVFVDVERNTHLINTTKIEEKITPRTKAIMPVHFAGQPCDMDEIMGIAKKHNLFVIEDAAHSFPAKYKGKQIGTIGDITCFSFYATKTLATGEGGMIATASGEWADKTSRLRLHGITKDAWKRYTAEGSWEYDVTDAGFKYNTTDIASAIGLEQLKKADWMNGKRRQIAQIYDGFFGSRDDLVTYTIRSDRESARHLYPLKIVPETLSIDRNSFIEKLKQKGVLTSVHFIPLYRFTYYKQFAAPVEEYPDSEWIFNRVISLPIFPGMSEAEISHVAESVLAVCRENRR